MSEHKAREQREQREAERKHDEVMLLAFIAAQVWDGSARSAVNIASEIIAEAKERVERRT